MRRLWQRGCHAVDRHARPVAGCSISSRADRPARSTTEACERVQSRGFPACVAARHGGSSLCPEVLRMTFGRITHFPALHVLNSTDPGQVKALSSDRLFRRRSLSFQQIGEHARTEHLQTIFFERTKQAVGAVKSAATSWPSPIRDRRCSRLRRRIASACLFRTPLHGGGRLFCPVEFRHGSPPR